MHAYETNVTVIRIDQGWAMAVKYLSKASLAVRQQRSSLPLPCCSYWDCTWPTVVSHASQKRGVTSRNRLWRWTMYQSGSVLGVSVLIILASLPAAAKTPSFV